MPDLKYVVIEQAETIHKLEAEIKGLSKENSIIVGVQGVVFGKNYWVSHEEITGCVANLIPERHKQYWEWVNAQAASQPAQQSAKDSALNDLMEAIRIMPKSPNNHSKFSGPFGNMLEKYGALSEILSALPERE